MTAFSLGLVSTSDFVDAIKSVRGSVDNFTSDRLGFDEEVTEDNISPVFAYSVFYVYFEQYLIILSETMRNMGLALLAIFVVTLLFLRDPVSPIIATFNVFLVVLTVLGGMNYLGIDLNPLSSSNLVMAIGITVEFTSRVLHTYKHDQGFDQADRIRSAMDQIGPSVINGAIATLVEFLPLAGAHYSLLQIYYFRMFAFVLLFGTFFGLIWLPALLMLLPNRCMRPPN